TDSATEELESTTNESNFAGAKGTGPSCASVEVLVSTVMPSMTASHAFGSGLLTESNCRGSLVFSNEASKPAKRQSLVGIICEASAALGMPDHCCQVGRSTIADFKKIVCQGVPRWMRPSSSKLNGCESGKIQLSDEKTRGSLIAGL